MEPEEEFKEFAKLLMSHGVKFMVIGGYAVIAYGHPRYTGDIDFFIEKSPENAKRMLAAITEFFGPQPALSIESFLDDERMSQLGVPPYRIDILVGIRGVTFSEAYPRHQLHMLAGAEVPFISYEDLIKSKKAAGRYKDLGDIEALELVEKASETQFPQN